jgi:translation initiation factor 2D
MPITFIVPNNYFIVSFFMMILQHEQISVKEDKFKKEVMLISVNRTHAEYSSFKPEKRQVEKNDQISDRAANESRSNKMLEVAEIYKPSVQVKSIFATVGADTGTLFSASEATDIVFKYIEKENLVKPTDRSIVVLDPILCDALFKGAIKKGSKYPTEIHKKDVGAAFIGRMQAHHIVTRGSESVVRKGGLKAIQILTERRQGNKKVTKLSGIETFLLDGEALASELQKKFACSTSVTELPGILPYLISLDDIVIIMSRCVYRLANIVRYSIYFIFYFRDFVHLMAEFSIAF